MTDTNDTPRKRTPAEVTEALDRVHDAPSPGGLDTVLAHLQRLTVAKVEW